MQHANKNTVSTTNYDRQKIIHRFGDRLVIVASNFFALLSQIVRYNKRIDKQR